MITSNPINLQDAKMDEEAYLLKKLGIPDSLKSILRNSKKIIKNKAQKAGEDNLNHREKYSFQQKDEIIKSIKEQICQYFSNKSSTIFMKDTGTLDYSLCLNKIDIDTFNKFIQNSFSKFRPDIIYDKKKLTQLRGQIKRWFNKSNDNESEIKCLLRNEIIETPKVELSFSNLIESQLAVKSTIEEKIGNWKNIISKQNENGLKPKVLYSKKEEDVKNIRAIPNFEDKQSEINHINIDGNKFWGKDEIKQDFERSFKLFKKFEEYCKKQGYQENIFNSPF